MATISLADFHKNQSSNSKKTVEKAQIVGFQGSADVTDRLQELGLRQGMVVEIVGQAPFSGPGLYRIGSVVVALRSEEASCVSIQPVGAS